LVHERINAYLQGKPADDKLTAEEKQYYDIDSRIEKQVQDAVSLRWSNFIKWEESGNVSLKKDDILGLELKAELDLEPPRGVTRKYVLRCDLDLITRTDIIDFKGGSLAYQLEYKWQLGAYKRAAKSLELDKESLTGDWNLRNVFLGDEDGPKEMIHKPDKITDAMQKFDFKLQEDMMTDFLTRTDPKYEAPCEFGIKCCFCQWRHICRGI
jgi:hypothetical protein